jgi:hypothetical protein
MGHDECELHDRGGHRPGAIVAMTAVATLAVIMAVVLWVHPGGAAGPAATSPSPVATRLASVHRDPIGKSPVDPGLTPRICTLLTSGYRAEDAITALKNQGVDAELAARQVNLVVVGRSCERDRYTGPAAQPSPTH